MRKDNDMINNDKALLKPDSPVTPSARSRGMLRAQEAYEPTFLAICGTHGTAICDTPTGGCLICLQEHVHLPPALQSKLAGGIYYFANCANCGDHKHHVANFKCSACFDAQGRTRRHTPISNRAQARRGGFRFYADACRQCRETTDHWVSNGKCVTCFTQAGTARVRRALSLRAEARARGDLSYVGSCATHGQVEFGVRYGKCLSCFTHDGRERGKGPNPKRVQARRDGERFYKDVCATHGETPHTVARGLCSLCFNGAGRKRKA